MEWDQANIETKESSLTITDTTYELAMNKHLAAIIFNCCYQQGSKTMNHAATKSDFCQYNINKCFYFVLQLIGVRGEHVAILASFLDLPKPHKWNRLVNEAEKFTHGAVQKIKALSQAMSVQDEVLETVHQENSRVEQNMLEFNRPVHRTQASYNMGWQVRSSSGRYFFPPVTAC